MIKTNASQGSLFISDFLTESIQRMPEWSDVSAHDIDQLKTAFEAIYEAFQIDQNVSEADTETELIWPILEALGWADYLTQQNLSPRGRDDVPDGLLFESAGAKTHATSFPEHWKRYGFGSAVVESKRWLLPLDRLRGRSDEVPAPSSQMLRYLRRIDDVTQGTLRWGILTNGAKWRLYFSGARSVSEQFFELDLAEILNLPGYKDGLFALNEEDRRHWLKVFILIFRREAFVPTGVDLHSFHQKAIDDGKYYEERVAENLSNKVFGEVFPELVRAIVKADPVADLQDVRKAALILLYRLLFILHAEDRDLLPVKDKCYDGYSLRDNVRFDVGRRKDLNYVFSDTASRYWNAISELFIVINQGDSSIGLPPYNGGLFDPDRTPILMDIRIPDTVMASVIDALSFEITDEGRKYINYRNLSVQQLGSIYERILEYEVTVEDGNVDIRPNIFARKESGSYYTPDELVHLILTETLEPLVAASKTAFSDEITSRAKDNLSDDCRNAGLRASDPATKLLDLKICDPAMGSGHFLVSLVDYLTGQVITAMAEAERDVPEEWGDYISPLSARIADIRKTILSNAKERKWPIDHGKLDDWHIIRRMVLKRCVYGVDKNPMAVELAKVSLWLHTFTVGAPLSFLDHHLRCGDSLFGSWVRSGMDKATAYGSPLLLHEPMKDALSAASKMQHVDDIPDAEIAEAHRSAELFGKIKCEIAPLDALLSLIHALDWLNIKGKAQNAAVNSFFGGEYGDPIDVVIGKKKLNRPKENGEETRMAGKITAAEKFDIFDKIYSQAKGLIDEETFMNWQVTFPGVWSDWEAEELTGGFDAIVGNPPWDRMKLQQVEWFAERRPEIARAPRASDRNEMIKTLEAAGDPLADDYVKASERAVTGTRMARKGGDYPLLSGGDINLYSLFVERAMTLVKRDGMVGLLVPSGIASDKTAANFFKGVSTGGRLKALYDFENKKVFFPDVHASFKFCIFVASPSVVPNPAKCAFYLHKVSELDDPNRHFPLSAEDFARLNPNTGTAPVFRSVRDAELTTAIYAHLPILVDRSGGEVVKAWPVKYATMFHMTNDSGLFRTRQELEEQEGAYSTGGNVFGSASGNWVPLYEGKMVQAFDHRAANVVVNPENRHRPAQKVATTDKQHQSPDYFPDPQYWVKNSEIPAAVKYTWHISYKMITAPTNLRTFIAASLPFSGVGNSMGIMLPQEKQDGFKDAALLILGNLNSMPFDFVVRQKIHGQNINRYIVEQLPVIPPKSFETTRFGPKTAAEIVRQAVLELSYTAHDMAPFACDMGYVDEKGKVNPPFIWDSERRLILRAKLDAVFFHLYGITDRDDVRYIYSTFPIVEREEKAKYANAYRSCDLCLGYMNALTAGDPDAEIG